MHVLLLIRSLEFGGAERQFIETASGLARAGCRVTACLMERRGPLVAALEATGTSVRDLGHRSRMDAPRSAIRLRRILRELDPDLVYSFLPVSNLIASIAAGWRLRKRVVWGTRASDMDMSQYGAFARLVARVEAMAAGLPALVICNSFAGARIWAQRGVVRDRLCVVPNAIDTARFTFDDQRRTWVRGEMAIAPGTRLVALVGRGDPVKGHDVLVKAFARLDARDDCVLGFVGPASDDFRRRIMRIASNAGAASRIVWMGAQDDMAAIYSAIDVLVSASRSEGFPNVLAEAMSVGCAIVATDAGDSAEVVGDQGIIVDRDSVELLATGVARAMQSAPGTRESRRRRIESLFGRDAAMEKLQGALRLALAASGGANRG